MTTDPIVHHAVSEVVLRYAMAIDARDWDLLASCFTDDCEADYGSIGQWSSAAELVASMRDVHEPLGLTLHRITNQLVRQDSNVVTARSYVDALVLLPDQTSGTNAIGYYDDELVRGGDGWKVARRRFTMVLLRLVPDGTFIDLATLAKDDRGTS